MTNTRTRCIMMVLLITAAAMVRADTIEVDGTRLEGVVVREGERNFYVQFPETGTVVSYDKSKVLPGSVTRSADRAALTAAWKQKSGRPALQEKASEALPTEGAPAPRITGTPEAARLPALVYDRSVEDPKHRVESLRLEGVSLETALKVMLRQAGLDFVIHDNLIYISDAETLRRESLEDLETRIYALENIGAETLPKIVIQNPGVQSGTGRGGAGGVQRGTQAGRF